MGKIFKAVGGLFGKLFSGPKMPKVETPAMPDRDSTTAKLAARKKIESRSKGGREGTIYSGSYSGSNLAGTG
jgi:hypothetical protein